MFCNINYSGFVSYLFHLGISAECMSVPVYDVLQQDQFCVEVQVYVSELISNVIPLKKGIFFTFL